MITQLPTSLSSIDPYFVFKGLFVVFSIFYFIFSVVAARQITLMTEVIKTEMGPVLRILGLLYALVSFGLIFFLLVVL